MNKKIIIKDESGVALVIALLIMVLLTILGTAAIMTSTTDVKIAANFKKSTNAFYAAEAGIEAGMDLLQSPGAFDANTGWNSLLTTYIYGDASSGTALSTDTNASYAVRVLDDELLDDAGETVMLWDVADEDDGGNVNTDTNRKVIIESTGRYGSSTVKLEAYVEYDQGYDSYGGKDLTSGNTNVASGESTWG